MKYSNNEITDNNFDDELEKLFELTGLQFATHRDDPPQKIDFVKELAIGFDFQMDENNLPCYVCTNFCPTPSYGGNGAVTERGYVAYEFSNGFMLIEICPAIISH